MSKKKPTLEALIRSVSTLVQVRDSAIPHPTAKGWFVNGDNGQQTVFSSAVAVSPWISTFYPDADMYDVPGVVADSNPSGQAVIKPFACMPPAPVYNYEEYEYDNVTVAPAAILSEVIAAGVEAQNVNDIRYLNVKPHIVNMSRGFSVNQMKAYLTMVYRKDTAGFSPFQAYSTLATYITGLNLYNNVRVDHMRAWEIFQPFAIGPGVRTLVNGTPRNSAGAAGYDTHLENELGPFFEPGIGLGVQAPGAGPAVPDVAIPQLNEDYDFYYNRLHAISDAHFLATGNEVPTPCFNGRQNEEPLIIFTASLDAAVAAHPNAAVISMPAAFTLGGERATRKRYAMLAAVFQPPMMTVISEVEYQTTLNDTVRGIMYWAGGTHRIMRPRTYIVSLPAIGADQTTTVAGRTIYFPSTGSVDVLTSIASDYGPAGTLLPAGTVIAPPVGVPFVTVPASAFIGSWIFSEQDFLAFKEELMSYWKCAEVYDMALDFLTHHVFTFRRPATVNSPAVGDLWRDQLGLSSYARAVYEMTTDDRDDALPLVPLRPYISEGYWTRMGVDHRSRSYNAEETMLVPKFDPVMAAAIFAGIYTVDTTEKKSAIHSQMNKAALDKHGVLAWLAVQQAVIFDAAYEELGLPPMLLMRGSSFKFDRYVINGTPAQELARVQAQSQFKQVADELWTEPILGVPVWGSLYGYFETAREKYTACPVPMVPAAAHKLRPRMPEPFVVFDDNGDRIARINSTYGGPLQVAAVGEDFVDSFEYGILTGWSFANNAGVIEAVPLSVSSQGVFSPIFHSWFSREFTYPDVGRRGTELMFSTLPPNVVASTQTEFGCRLLPTVPGVNQQVGGGDFRPMGKPYRYEAEIALCLMKQVAGVPPRRLVTYTDATVMFSVRGFGRPNLDSGTWIPPTSDSVLPPVQNGTVGSWQGLYASRFPTIDASLSWLYWAVTDAEYRQLLYAAEGARGRPSGLQYLSPTQVTRIEVTDARNFVFVSDTRAKKAVLVLEGGTQDEKQPTKEAEESKQPETSMPSIPDGTIRGGNDPPPDADQEDADGA